MWPGAVTTQHNGPRYYGDVTGTYAELVIWHYSYAAKKKPFTLSDFIQNKRRITEAWHEPFQYELARWRQLGKISMVTATYFWERTVEYIMKVQLCTDWRWVFKRWLQDLYADM